MPLIRHASPLQPAMAQAAVPKAPEALAPVVGSAVLPLAAEPRLKTPAEIAETAKPVYTGRKATSDTMSKEEWAAKDRRIGRAGLYQAALQSVGVLQYSPDVRTFEDYLKAVRKAAEDGLRFVNEVAE